MKSKSVTPLEQMIAARLPFATANKRDEVLLAMPCMSDSLPFGFANGMIYHGWHFDCLWCDAAVTDGSVRGRVEMLTPHSALLEGLGECPVCAHRTRYHVEVFDNLTCRLLDADGKWVTRSLAAWPVRMLVLAMLPLVRLLRVTGPSRGAGRKRKGSS